MKDRVLRAGYLTRSKEPSSSHLLSQNIERPRRSSCSYGESPEQRRQRLKELRERHSKLPEGSFADYDLGDKELPAYKHKAEILDTLSENKIVDRRVVVKRHKPLSMHSSVLIVLWC